MRTRRLRYSPTRGICARLPAFPLPVTRALPTPAHLRLPPHTFFTHTAHYTAISRHAPPATPYPFTPLLVLLSHTCHACILATAWVPLPPFIATYNDHPHLLCTEYSLPSGAFTMDTCLPVTATYGLRPTALI